jgi:hypothetical protein
MFIIQLQQNIEFFKLLKLWNKNIPKYTVFVPISSALKAVSFIRWRGWNALFQRCKKSIDL